MEFLTMHCTILLALTSLVTAWNPDAGLVTSYTKMAGVSVKASSNSNDGLSVIDGDDNTHWMSAGCLPSAYLSNNFLNVVLDLCGEGHCTSSSTSDMRQLGLATDGSFYSNLNVGIVNGTASFSLHLPQPLKLKYISVRGRFTAETELRLVSSDGADRLVKKFTSQDSYKLITLYTLNLTTDVTSLRMTSESRFSLSDVGALGQEGCVDRVTVDLGVSRQIGVIRTRHWAGSSALTSRLLTSDDGVTWTVTSTLVPGALKAVMTYLNAPRRGRYVAVEHVIKEENYAKSYVWEIDVWNSNGPWGPAPSPRPNPKSLRSILGVNGIWGWGQDSYSDAGGAGAGAGAGGGPGLYVQVASQGRNYHDLNWDVLDPDSTPNYTAMALGKGTQAQWWLNWDREYGAWRGAGLTVDASVQFTARTFPPGLWDDPRGAAFRYGRAFARHFGPSLGTGHVQALEVGNEPWDYNATFYAQILEGMASGAKQGDAAMLVLPGAFQAHDRFAETAPNANYIGSRLTKQAAVHLDAVNGHFYSFHEAPDGTRQASFPERPDSSFNGVRNLLRWRDANMAGKPVWVTEWGWDSGGVGESCRFSECVSEEASAFYALRGLMILARLGVEKAHWFFYANDKGCDSHVFCRSGLTGSKNVGFRKKKVFLAFQELLGKIGDRKFVDVVREDSSAHVYLFGHVGGSHAPSATSPAHSTHVVAWRPTDANDTSALKVTFTLNATPARAWRLGSETVTLTSEDLPKVNQAVWTINVTVAPLLIELA